MVLIFIFFDFINFGNKLRYMYRKNRLFLRGEVLQLNLDYIETKISSSILFKASPIKTRERKISLDLKKLVM